jgi:diguanylate cyclase (GGDEF)-like protein/PAS domain S-box-containing protein
MPIHSVEPGGRSIRSAQVPVIAGFGIMILLLIGVAAIGVSHVRILSTQLTAIVAERNLKSELASSMKTLHDARYQAIVLASHQEDPFESDALRMRFSDLARDFIVLRDRFLALSLDENELAAWGEVRKELPMVEQLSNEVFDLIQAGKLDQAKQRIRQDLKPRQISMMSQWERLVDMQRVKNTEAVSEAGATSEQVRGLVLGLSAVALLVAVAVAAFVVRLSRRMEADIYQERERAVVTLRSLGDAVLRFDHERRVSYLNPAAETLLGALEESSIGMPAAEVLRLFERESRADLTVTLLDEVLKDMVFVLPPSACLLSALGMEFEVEGKCASIHGADGSVIGGVLVMSDVTEARELHRKLLWHSDHDVLTGLANRYAFEEHLAQSLASHRASDLVSSLLLINLDQLKQIREQAGQACSDELVCQVAHLMALRVRDSDFLARLGEDEFGVLLHACPDGMAEHIAEQIRDSVLGYQLPWQGNTYGVGVHVGVAHLAEKPHEECLGAAYSALHEAETRGSGSVVVAHTGQARSVTRPEAD